MTENILNRIFMSCPGLGLVGAGGSKTLAWGFAMAPHRLSALVHIYIVYGMDPAQLLHVVVKQAGKLYFRFAWSQTQR